MALKPWLFTIVRNRALDERRRSGRTVDLELHAGGLHDLAGDPAESVVRAEAPRALVAALREMPERQRTALVLHELGGRSHGAIGRELDVSAGGSKALVSRARPRLAEARVAA